jgi:membrane-bound lytic murein transglycosylase F
VGSELYSVGSNKISIYDAEIKKQSKRLNWDWRLFASLIYHESNFKPEVRAWSGAYGLLQLMPWVMEQYGLDSISSPNQQIAAGARYIASIDKQFKSMVPDPVERQKFVLAAYNVGLAHVFDARRLAKKYGRKDDVWTTQVDSFILWKSEPKYYRDRLAFYGYCRGEEPFHFVEDVMEMYGLYKNVIKY